MSSAENPVSGPSTARVYLQRPRRESMARLGRRAVADKLALVALVFFGLMILMSLLAPILAPIDSKAMDLAHRLQGPVWTTGGSWSHAFGTDQQGRDLMSRLIWGGRVSLRIGFLVVIGTSLIGTTLGLIAGLSGGRIDSLIMRVVDIFFSLPGLLIALVFVMAVGVGERNLIIALTINGWMVFARLSRGLVAALRGGPLIEAAVAVGVRRPRIVVRHVLPNVVAPILTLFVLEVAYMILAEAAMSFLGYGIQAPSVSWGLIIGQSRNYITNAPWLIILPGILLSLTILSFNLIANWLRTEVDPLQQQTLAKIGDRGQ